MAYLFATPEQQREMLDRIGCAKIEDLFEPIPKEVRLDRPLDLPPPLTEIQLEQLLRECARSNKSSTCFLGGGAYDHFVPAAVDTIASRSEFYTAYTPYQAEASQGTLQAFFEYQTLVCQLTGMDVANASLYEAGSGLVEAMFMALRGSNRNQLCVLSSLNPQYLEVIRTYFNELDADLAFIPCKEGQCDLDALRKSVSDQTAAVVIQHPNFFGCLEKVNEISGIAKSAGALSIVAYDPLSLGLLTRPADYGADIAVAEGQPLGIPLQYGGPYLGMLSCKEAQLRKIPGRLIGITNDRHGNRCFVLNLQAREQHIRRDKATSNICTNQGLLALRATVYLSLMGPKGLAEAASLCHRKARYTAEELAKIPGYGLSFPSVPYFKEFTVQSRKPIADLLRTASSHGFSIGPAVSEKEFLIAVTEQRTKYEIDGLLKVLRDWMGAK